MSEREPEAGLREVVHQRVRLGVLAVLDRRGRATFSEVRDALAQSDGSLSRHLGVLEEHGFVATEKVFENRRPRTWITLTDAGVQALRQEQETLSKLLAAAADGPARTSAGGADTGETDLTAAMAIAFAALLGDESDADAAADTEGTVRDHAALVVADADPITERGGRLVIQGAITNRYDFPAEVKFGADQQAQRLMMVSHGLRGGWFAIWSIPAESGADDESLMAQWMVIELGTPGDAAAILGVMGETSLTLSEVPGSRAYLLPAPQQDQTSGKAETSTRRTAAAWFAQRRYLACVVIVGPETTALELIQELAVTARQHLEDLTGSPS